MILRKDGENHLDRSCEKLRNITWKQRGEEYPTYDKNKDG